jgi:hypothetical protein
MLPVCSFALASAAPSKPATTCTWIVATPRQRVLLVQPHTLLAGTTTNLTTTTTSCLAASSQQ